MFEKEAWVMVAIGVIPIVLGIVLALILPLLVALGYIR